MLVRGNNGIKMIPGKNFLGLVQLDTVSPLTSEERNTIDLAVMACLLEDGELGQLATLLSRYEETIRGAEKANQEAFEKGRQQGMRQERALWELARIGQEMGWGDEK